MPVTSSPAPTSRALWSQAAKRRYGDEAAEMFGAGAVRSLGRQLVKDPGLLCRRLDLVASGGQQIDVAAKQDADAASEKLVAQLERRMRSAEASTWIS